MKCKQEVKDEARQNEGDPMIKQRIRTAQRSLIRKRMMQDVNTADVVIVNPIHIAVAIRYDPMVAQPTIIVAIGQRMIAERIKKIAFESGGAGGGEHSVRARRLRAVRSTRPAINGGLQSRSRMFIVKT